MAQGAERQSSLKLWLAKQGSGRSKTKVGTIKFPSLEGLGVGLLIGTHDTRETMMGRVGDWVKG
jgi:hypothetical protein